MREKAIEILEEYANAYSDFDVNTLTDILTEIKRETAREFATNFENNLCDVNTDYCTDDTVPEALFTSAEIDTVMDRTLKDFGVEVEE